MARPLRTCSKPILVRDSSLGSTFAVLITRHPNPHLPRDLMESLAKATALASRTVAIRLPMMDYAGSVTAPAADLFTPHTALQSGVDGQE